jgi:hypothetical protein
LFFHRYTEQNILVGCKSIYQGKKMTRLRSATKKQIQTIFEHSKMAADAFSVHYDEENATFLRIIYTANPSTRFEIRTPLEEDSRRTILVSFEAPGRHIEGGEAYNRDNLDECIAAATDWLKRVEEDYLDHNPLVEEFEQFKAECIKSLDVHLRDKHAHGYDKEITELKKTLADMSGSLAALGRKQQQTAENLEAVTHELAHTREALDRYSAASKGTWYRVEGSRVLKQSQEPNDQKVSGQN